MLTLKTEYAKKLGLKNFSSHSFSAEILVELNSADDIPKEVARLYHLLQSNVDQQIVSPGFVPSDSYGMATVNQRPPSAPPQMEQAHQPSNVTPITTAAWLCSPKQQELILKLIDENNLDKVEIENLASQRFGKGVKQLNKLEASSLISLIFDAQLKKPAQGQQRQYGKGGQR